jgi:Subtilase family/Putative Ig domain
MKSAHHLSVGVAALVGIITAASSASPPPPLLARARSVEPGGAQLMAFGGRSFAQLHSTAGKLDAALADLSRHANLARPGRVLADLHAMSPAARFTQSGTTPMVAVDAVTRGDPQKLAAALVALGLKHPAIYRNDVGGWLPVSAITTAAARTEVLSLRAAMPHTRGVVATQGDFAIGSLALRTAYPSLTGAGVTVGVLSDSFDCYYVYAQPGSGVPASGPNGYAENGFTADAQADEADGALPPAADINVLEEAGGTFGTAGSQGCLSYGQPLELPFTDEGRAIMQVVHAVAPGANLAFYTADNSEADFANGVERLAEPLASGGAGATVEADDVGYYDEPFFQDGLVAQAIDTVEAQGVAYFSAAGNNSDLAYDNNAPAFGTTKVTVGDGNSEYLLNFNTAGTPTATSLPVTIPALVPGEFIAMVLEWNQPYVTGAPGSPGASSEMDLCVTGASASTTVVNLDGNPQTCTGPNTTGTDPVQILIVGNSAAATSNTAQQTIDLIVGLYGGTTPTMIKLAVEDGGAGSVIETYATNSATLQGHPSATGAAAVGAAAFYSTPACGTSPAQLEYYSALGGAPILFNTSGTAITAEYRQKPDFVGPDGVNNTFLGFQIPAGTDTSTVAQCANNATYPNFYGTSAATPHAAGAAALMLQANPAVTPAEIYANLRSSASAMGTVPNPPSTYNYNDGYGFIQAEAAMALLPAGPPVITVTPSTLGLGGSSTLSWLAVNDSACTASGSWSGAQATSGTKTLTPTATGSTTYTIACTTASGTQSASATLTVVSALSITTTSLASGQVGTAYSATLAATGGVAPYTWSVTGGTLPAGLTLSSGGAITGTPTAAVSASSVTFQVADSEKPAETKTVTLSMTIAAAPSSGGGGGGGLGGVTLLALAGFVLARLLRAAPALVPCRVRSRERA